MAMFATSRAKVVHSTCTFFMKIVNWYFERHHFFRRRQFLSFDGASVRITGQKTVLVSLGEFFGLYYCNKSLRLASEKLVLASESNLSLATGLNLS